MLPNLGYNMTESWCKLQRSCQSHDRKCVRMADFVNFWENRINSFKNLPLQTHQSECYQIWVKTLGQDPVFLWFCCKLHFHLWIIIMLPRKEKPCKGPPRLCTIHIPPRHPIGFSQKEETRSIPPCPAKKGYEKWVNISKNNESNVRSVN